MSETKHGQWMTAADATRITALVIEKAANFSISRRSTDKRVRSIESDGKFDTPLGQEVADILNGRPGPHAPVARSVAGEFLRHARRHRSRLRETERVRLTLIGSLVQLYPDDIGQSGEVRRWITALQRGLRPFAKLVADQLLNRKKPRSATRRVTDVDQAAVEIKDFLERVATEHAHVGYGQGS